MRLLNGTGEWEMENENKEETTPTKNQIEVLLLCLTKMTEEIKKRCELIWIVFLKNIKGEKDGKRKKDY